MSSKLLCIYERKDPYVNCTKYNRINRYHCIIAIKCYHEDNSQERLCGTLLNGVPFPDYYSIHGFNFMGECVHMKKFENKDKANEYFLAIKKSGEYYKRRIDK
jgi:hypothetical protein